MITLISQSLRKSIALDVLEAAKDVGDESLIAACRRIIRGHERRGDVKLVSEFYPND